MLNEKKQHLFEDAHIKYFFDVSVAAAKERQSPLGHVLFVCPDEETTKSFIELLKESYQESGFSETSLLSGIKASELAAMLTSLSPGDFLLSDSPKLTLDDEVKSLLKKAASDWAIDVLIGKGPGARSVRLDMPEFTFVLCVSQATATVNDLIGIFDHVIKVDDVNLPKICVSKIKSECTYPMQDEAYDLLAYRAKYDVKMSLRYLNRIIEYAKFQNAETITRDVVDDALELAGLGTYFEDIEEDNDEMMQVFREINDSLTSIKEDVSFMRSRMEDFLDANGIL